METFTAPDGTRLAYHVIGKGEPLLVLPGGAMRDSAYLGDLGGLSAHRALHMLDLRGTGRSETPADTSSYRCDRQVADVEALRAHLGLERADVLGHSAGAILATLYALRHPDRTGKLALVTPSLRAFGFDTTEEDYRSATAARGVEGEPWFPAAWAALEAAFAGTATEADEATLSPLYYGRWDATAQAHAAVAPGQLHPEAARIYYSGGCRPDEIRAAAAGVASPVLILAGEFDAVPRPDAAKEAAALFPNGETAVLPAGGHYPWLDDADAFVRTLAGFLDRPLDRP
ncbi:alpha/beta hydrolase [Kitasatospora sp. NPDC088351]|uniref:alpha/beta fold hydrolase n=1 Tax=Kitasatospora sp. NPDC088351 TaxID=3155180 RepID=UPI00343BECE6